MAELSQEDYDDVCDLSIFFADLPELVVYGSGNSWRNIGVIEAQRRMDSPILGNLTPSATKHNQRGPATSSWIIAIEEILRVADDADELQLPEPMVLRQSSGDSRIAQGSLRGTKRTPPTNKLGFFRKCKGEQAVSRRSLSVLIPPRTSSLRGARIYVSDPLPCSSIEKSRYQNHQLPSRQHVEREASVEQSAPTTSDHQRLLGVGSLTSFLCQDTVGIREAGSGNVAHRLAQITEEARVLAMRMDALVALQGDAGILREAQEVEDFMERMEIVEDMVPGVGEQVDEMTRLWEMVDWMRGVRGMIEDVLVEGGTWKRLTKDNERR